MSSITNSYSKIPEELQQLRQWVCWKYVERNGKLDKPPHQLNGEFASVSDPSTWCTFKEAVAAVEASAHGFIGIGFVFTEHDHYAGIDLDNVAKKLAETADKAKAEGRPLDEAKLLEMEALTLKQQTSIFNEFNSYTEVSPSSKGAHIIIKVTDKNKIWKGQKRNAVEMYCQGRFFTMTGNVYLPVPIAERQGLAEHCGHRWAKERRINNKTTMISTKH